MPAKTEHCPPHDFLMGKCQDCDKPTPDPTVDSILDQYMVLVLPHVEDVHRHIGLFPGAFYPSLIDGMVRDKTEGISTRIWGLWNHERVDSHSGKRTVATVPSVEWLWMTKILFYLELVRQSSLIHTGRGKAVDTQYLQTKRLILRYFDKYKGMPDEVKKGRDRKRPR